MEFFNTTAGAASILAFVLGIVFWIIDRTGQRRLEVFLADSRALMAEGQRRGEDGQKRLEALIASGTADTKRIIEQGNERLERFIERTDSTTKEILRELGSKVA